MKSDTLDKAGKKFSLLRAILVSPESYTDPALAKAIATQESFASYESLPLEISKFSLNSLKQAADKLVPGGFATIDRQRKLCIAALSKVPVPEERRDTVRSLQSQNKANRIAIEALEAHVMRLTYLFRETYKLYKNAAQSPPELCALIFESDNAYLNALIAGMDLNELGDLNEKK
ncbi:hypothetical protein ACQ4OD_13155 [Pseudomonas sp. WC1]|uniref:hypothetical protein n=1 Tax=Pseudomonas sp. WC1 TaxID=3424772 RepID=UPI003D35875C